MNAQIREIMSHGRITIVDLAAGLHMSKEWLTRLLKREQLSDDHVSRILDGLSKILMQRSEEIAESIQSVERLRKKLG